MKMKIYNGVRWDSNVWNVVSRFVCKINNYVIINMNGGPITT